MTCIEWFCRQQMLLSTEFFTKQHHGLYKKQEKKTTQGNWLSFWSERHVAHRTQLLTRYDLRHLHLPQESTLTSSCNSVLSQRIGLPPTIWCLCSLGKIHQNCKLNNCSVQNGKAIVHIVSLSVPLLVTEVKTQMQPRVQKVCLSEVHDPDVRSRHCLPDWHCYLCSLSHFCLSMQMAHCVTWTSHTCNESPTGACFGASVAWSWVTKQDRKSLLVEGQSCCLTGYSLSEFTFAFCLALPTELLLSIVLQIWPSNIFCHSQLCKTRCLVFQTLDHHSFWRKDWREICCAVYRYNIYNFWGHRRSAGCNTRVKCSIVDKFQLISWILIVLQSNTRLACIALQVDVDAQLEFFSQSWADIEEVRWQGWGVWFQGIVWNR